MDKDLFEKEDISVKEKKKLTSFQKTILMFSLTFVLTVIVCKIFFLPSYDNYIIFTKKRIAEMENRFGIEVNDDIKLNEYKAIYLQGSLYILKADVKDYRSFMQNNINGDIISVSEYEKYELESDTVAIYNYKISRGGLEIECKATFKDNDTGVYKASFTTYN